MDYAKGASAQVGSGFTYTGKHMDNFDGTLCPMTAVVYAELLGPWLGVSKCQSWQN